MGHAERWSACTKRGAIGRWRGVCRVYARFVQHSHWCDATGPESSDQQGPHTGTARARNDHHAVAQVAPAGPLQAHSTSPWAPWQALRRELFGATGWRTRPRNRAGLQAERQPEKGQHKAGLGSARAVGLGHLSSAGHAHVVQPGPPHPSLEDEHLFRLLRHWHRLSLATTGGYPMAGVGAHRAKGARRCSRAGWPVAGYTSCARLCEVSRITLARLGGAMSPRWRGSWCRCLHPGQRTRP